MESNGRKPRVFISFASEEEAIAKRVNDALESNGFECWFAPEEIGPGGNYLREIPQAIEKCDAFVLLISKSAQDSEYVTSELDTAIKHKNKYKNKIRVYPVFVEDCTLTIEFGFLLSHINYISYQRDLDVSINKLLLALKEKFYEDEMSPPEPPESDKHVKIPTPPKPKFDYRLLAIPVIVMLCLAAGGFGARFMFDHDPAPTSSPVPTAKPTAAPTAKPTAAPTAKPTAAPTAKPTAAPTAKPTAAPTATPTTALKVESTTNWKFIGPMPTQTAGVTLSLEQQRIQREQERIQKEQERIQKEIRICDYQGNICMNNGEYDQAFRFYEHAASLGSAEAMYTLGNMFREEVYGMVDYKRAEEWYLKAAEKENIDAMEALENMYSEEKYGMVNDVEAVYWGYRREKARIAKEIDSLDEYLSFDEQKDTQMVSINAQLLAAKVGEGLFILSSTETHTTVKPEDYKWTLIDTENGKGIQIVQYIGTDEQVSIPAEIDGYPVVEIADYAFSECSGITGVGIPFSVTRIGWCAFFGCSSLTRIEIPNRETEIDEYAFGECEHLTICAYYGSCAETYATGNGIRFVEAIRLVL